jgi:hypothetical protein
VRTFLVWFACLAAASLFIIPGAVYAGWVVYCDFHGIKLPYPVSLAILGGVIATLVFCIVLVQCVYEAEGLGRAAWFVSVFIGALVTSHLLLIAVRVHIPAVMKPWLQRLTVVNDEVRIIWGLLTLISLLLLMIVELGFKPQDPENEQPNDGPAPAPATDPHPAPMQPAPTAKKLPLPRDLKAAKDQPDTTARQEPVSECIAEIKGQGLKRRPGGNYQS